jgi:hypothetical protein
MRWALSLVAALLAAGALAGPARAAQGTGLYEPFPSPTGGARAERYVADFGVRLEPAQLRVGVQVHDGLPRSGGGAASARAGVGADGRADDLLLGAAFVLILVGLAVLVPLFRRS